METICRDVECFHIWKQSVDIIRHVSQFISRNVEGGQMVVTGWKLDWDVLDVVVSHFKVNQRLERMCPAFFEMFQ